MKSIASQTHVKVLAIWSALASILAAFFFGQTMDRTSTSETAFHFRRGSPSDRSTQTSMDKPAATIYKPSEEIETLQADNLRLQAQLDDLLNWILAHLKGRYPIPKSYLSHLKAPSVSPKFQLDDGVAELLQVTHEEKDVINKIFRLTREFIHEMERATMKVQEENDERVLIHIPPFAGESGNVREEFYSSLNFTLGKPRFDQFLTYSEDALDSSFNHFGERDRTISFELVSVEGSSEQQIRITDGWLLEHDAEHHTYHESETLVDELPEKYLAYVDWLPEYSQQHNQ